MTKLLEKALAEVSKLPPESQDAIAQLILDELSDEEAWDQALARSGQALDRLAQEALAEHRAGRTHELGFDE
jgi:hypothetical protein